MIPPGRQLPPPALADAEVVDDYAPTGQTGGTTGGFKPRKLLSALRRFWWVPLLTLILGVGAGAAWVRYLPPTYVSTAQMWEAMKIKLPEGGVFAEDVQTFLGTQTELLKSPTVQDLAIGRLRISGTNVHIPLDKDGKPLPVNVQLRQASKSAVYLLTATGTDPDYTRRFLDALMLSYLDYRRDIRKAISGDTLASISEQVQKAERDLKEAHEAFTAYQRTNNLAIVQQESTVAGAYLAQLQTRLADLELEAQLMDVQPRPTTNSPIAVDAATDASAGHPGANPESHFSGTSANLSPEAQVALRELAAIQSQKERLGRYLRPKHPKMVRLNTEIERVEALLGIYQKQNESALAVTRRSIDLKIENVKATIQEWQTKVIQANTKLADAERIKLEIQRNQGAYDRLTAIVQNVGLSRNIDQDSLAVLENADTARRTFQKEVTGVALATLAGLGLGLGFIALIAFRDDRFETHVDLDETLGGGVVGHLPEIEVADKESAMPLLAMDDSRHMFAESYRSLRSALLYLSNEQRRPAVLLITSAAPGEGKSTVAVNLARTLSFGGARVLLIDADLRRGQLHKVLGGRQEPGLAEVLHHPERLTEAVQNDSLPNFSFIATGSEIGNPGDLILSRGFPQLLSELRQRYDYILIDSSPVFAADDASTMAAHVDGTLFVVRRGYSRSGLVQEALQVLVQRQARILGIVFNRADTSLRSYQYYKYSEYYRQDRNGSVKNQVG